MGLGKTIQVCLTYLYYTFLLLFISFWHCSTITGYNIFNLTKTLRTRRGPPFSSLPRFCFGKLGKRTNKVVPKVFCSPISWSRTICLLKGVELFSQSWKTTPFQRHSSLLLSVWTTQVSFILTEFWVTELNFCWHGCCCATSFPIHVPRICHATWQIGFCFWLISVLIFEYVFLSAQQKDDRKILKRWRWSCVLMDEAHALKDKNSYRWKNLMSVARNANQRLMLTGTPLQNDLHVWDLFICYFDRCVVFSW